MASIQSSENHHVQIVEIHHDEKEVKLEKIRSVDAKAEDYDQERWAEQLDDSDKDFYGPRLDSFSFTDVAFDIKLPDKSTKHILKPMSGAFTRGQLVAIMGPSGCGKSTLLDILSGKKTAPYTGEVLVNGHQRDKFFQRVTSYVAQEDIYNGNETVREALEFVSLLKGDYGTPEILRLRGITAEELARERKVHIEVLLRLVGLDKVADSKVGNAMMRGISGGQKRRLTLAKGLVTGPMIAFLDEPTSGLSSTDADLCVQCLLNCSQGFNVTFFVVIHQPRLSVFQKFHHLILLTDGHMVYNNRADKAIEYFESMGAPLPPMVNPADHFLDVVTPGVKGSLTEDFIVAYNDREAPRVKKQIEAIQPSKTVHQSLVDLGWASKTDSIYVTSLCRQVQLLAQREWSIIKRDTMTVGFLFVNAIVLGLLLGLVYLDVYGKGVIYHLGFVFMVIVTVTLTCFNSVPALVDTRVLFSYEKAEGLYSVFPFVIVKTLSAVLVNALANTLMIILLFFMADFPASYFVPIWLLLTLAWCAVDGLVTFAAVMSENHVTANALAGAIVGIFATFNGYTANPESMPSWLGWLCYLSPFYWVFEAFVNIAYKVDDYDFECAIDTVNLVTIGKDCPFFKVEDVFDTYGLEDRLIVSIIILLSIFIVSRFAVGWGLNRTKLQK